MDTNVDWSPHDLLPQPNPKTTEYSVDFFYEMVSKHLVKDVVRIMNNGIQMDMHKIAELQEVLDNRLKEVDQILENNPIIKEFQAEQYKKLIEEYIALQREKMKSHEEFPVKWKYDLVCRSYFMKIWLEQNNVETEVETSDTLPTGIPKWTVNQIKAINKELGDPILQALIDKSLPENHPLVQQTIRAIQEDKAALWNAKYEDNIQNAKTRVEFPKFNPGSAPQKAALMEWLGYESDIKSKTTGNDSWGRKALEALKGIVEDKDVKEIVEAFLDFSSAAIIRRNFIEAFYNYSVDGRLYGTVNLGAAISFRNTSNNP